MLQKQVSEGIFKKFDYWIVIEGASKNNGSTSWCNDFPEKYHKNGLSIDGTHEYLLELSKTETKLKYIYKQGLWESKDDQVNQILPILDNIPECILWEIDVDEFWNLENIKLSEYQLKTAKAKGASFLCDYLVGENLIVKGNWGEGNKLRYNRLWAWKNGESFLSHEPPILQGQTDANTLKLPYRFTHYSYVDEETVAFKDEWYGGHKGILDNWRRLNSLDESEFPRPISDLLPDLYWADKDTFIHYVKPPVFDLYIQWFKSSNETRNQEVIKSIYKNSCNKFIRKIVIFAESKFDQDIPKVEIVDLGRRMTYLDCFQHIKYCSDHNGYFIIANSDIIIPEDTTKKLEYQDVTLKNTFIALSRYEYLEGKIDFIGYTMAPCSQDTWIFKKEDIDIAKFQQSNFYLGICACDNRIARIAYDSGLKVINPSLYLKTVHLHESHYRTYASNTGLYGTILFLNPSDNLEETPGIQLSHSLWENFIYV